MLRATRFLSRRRSHYLHSFVSLALIVSLCGAFLALKARAQDPPLPGEGGPPGEDLPNLDLMRLVQSVVGNCDCN